MKTDTIMMRSRMYTVLFFSCFLVLANGQDKHNIPAYLTQKFLHYVQSVPREEVYVHTDRQSYISGETIWFKVYVQDKLTAKLSLNSHITYFELLNYNNQPIVRKRVQTIGGFGSGSLVLPDSLSSGTYTIKAYTGWMKNFLPDNCFTGRISIYNAIYTDTYRDVAPSANTTLSNGISIGVSLFSAPSAKDSVEFGVVTDSNYRVVNKENSYIFIQNRGTILSVDSIALTGDSVKISLHKSRLREGMNHITIFNILAEPVYEGYYLNKVAHSDSLNITSVDSTGMRNKVSVQLGTKDMQLPIGRYSLSVSPAQPKQESEHISHYFLHGSEFGIAGEPLTTLSRDSLFQVSGNWIDWKKILNEKHTQLIYGFEKEIHLLSGKLADRELQKGLAGELVLLCIPGKSAVFAYSKTDSEGNFYFPLPVDGQIRDLIIMPDRPAQNKILSINTGFPDHEKKTGSVLMSNHAMPTRIAQSSVNYQVQKIYGMSFNTPPETELVAEVTRFYGKPDQELVMADYISLPTMEEVFFELLPHVSFRKRNAVFEIMITDRIDNKPYFSLPVLMIDGVIIKDPAMIIEMDPELVEKIDVIRGIHIVGQYVFRGIVNVITKSGDFSNATLPGYMIRIPYRAVERDPVFASPDYSQDTVKLSRLPDYRNTLYWNPEIFSAETDKQIEFWSADKAGDYEITLQGYSQEKGWISLSKVIKIR